MKRVEYAISKTPVRRRDEMDIETRNRVRGHSYANKMLVYCRVYSLQPCRSINITRFWTVSSKAIFETRLSRNWRNTGNTAKKKTFTYVWLVLREAQPPPRLNPSSCCSIDPPHSTNLSCATLPYTYVLLPRPQLSGALYESLIGACCVMMG